MNKYLYITFLMVTGSNFTLLQGADPFRKFCCNSICYQFDTSWKYFEGEELEEGYYNNFSDSLGSTLLMSCKCRYTDSIILRKDSFLYSYSHLTYKGIKLGLCLYTHKNNAHNQFYTLEYETKDRSTELVLLFKPELLNYYQETMYQLIISCR